MREENIFQSNTTTASNQPGILAEFNVSFCFLRLPGISLISYSLLSAFSLSGFQGPFYALILCSSIKSFFKLLLRFTFSASIAARLGKFF